MKFYEYQEVGNDIYKILSFVGCPKRCGSFNQKPDDFQGIINLIVKSSLKDVQIALNKNFDRNTKLNSALKKFRQYFAPKVFTSPAIYFNYNNLYTLVQLIGDRWNDLIVKKDNEKCYDKRFLVCQQILGFVMRGLQWCDLQNYAEDLSDVVKYNPRPIARLNNFINEDKQDCIPISAIEAPLTGLGFDFWLGNTVKK